MNELLDSLMYIHTIAKGSYTEAEEAGQDLDHAYWSGYDDAIRFVIKKIQNMEEQNANL